MKKYLPIAVTFGFALLATLFFKVAFKGVTPEREDKRQPTETTNLPALLDQIPGTMIPLPEPLTDGTVSIEKALSQRRSIRSYVNQPLNLEEVSQLLWAAQGINNERGFRTAPSAGATFPLELFVMVNNVKGLSKGIYHYKVGDHQLELIDQRELENELARAALSQSMISKAGIVIIFAAIYERTTNRYGERGIRYIHNEVGHVGQNIHLQAAALNLGTVVIGAYRDEEAEALLKLGEEYRVLYFMPVGKI
ncbi:MAG: SagB/ThcOx family dehydrogenase [Bacteroides sp.]|nr:SagB/ThcOx family dehydrogenase [Bacteroides sp.]